MADIEKIVKDGLKTSKWTDNLSRMTEARKWIDYYNYRQNDTSSPTSSYVMERIKKQFPKTFNDLQPYIRTFPITEQIINDISIIFNRPALFTINPDKELEETDPLVMLFKDKIVDQPLLNSVMINVNRYTNLLHKIGVFPRWSETRKQIEYVILTPDKCFVVQDPDSPTHAIAVFYKADELLDTPQTAVSQNLWIMLTENEISKVEINYQSGDVKILSTEPNIYGQLPVVWFQNQLPIDTFWLDKGQPIVDINEDYNVYKTLEKLAITYQMYSTLVMWGMPAEKEINWGVRAVVNFGISDDPSKQAGDAKYITPDPKLTEVSAIIEGDINSIAGFAGLSEEAYRKKTNSFTSGYHLELSKQDVVNNNELEKQLYTQSLKQLLLLACKVYTQHNKDGKSLDAVESVLVDYQQIVFKQNQLELRQIWLQDKALGITSPIQIMIEQNPELTREQATALFEQLKQENQTYTSSIGLDKALGIDEDSQ